MVRIAPFEAAPFDSIFDNVQLMSVEVSPSNDVFKVKVSFYRVLKYSQRLQQDTVREIKRQIIKDQEDAEKAVKDSER
jgi:hypothetical protein